jgi:hypothetical protein
MERDQAAVRAEKENKQGRSQLKRKTIALLLALTTLIPLAGTSLGQQQVANAITKIQLRQNALPEGMQIEQEVWASEEHLRRVRLRGGFPVSALLNQVVSRGEQKAQVNYLLIPGEDWLAMGYSNLTEAEGMKSLIFPKDSVLVQIAATTGDLEYQLARLVGADSLHFIKLRLGAVPPAWEIKVERAFLSTELGQLDYEVGVPVEAAIFQEFIAGHTTVEIQYFRCSDSEAALNLVQRLTAQCKPFSKMLIGVGGPNVVVSQSQNEKLNTQVMNLVKWPKEHKVQILPVRSY